MTWEANMQEAKSTLAKLRKTIELMRRLGLPSKMEESMRMHVITKIESMISILQEAQIELLTRIEERERACLK